MCGVGRKAYPTGNASKPLSGVYMKCWLCNRDGFSPGEIKLDIFGDPQCIYCEGLLSLTVTHLRMVDTFQQKIPRKRVVTHICKIRKGIRH